jgi:hypothetical protein
VWMLSCRDRDMVWVVAMPCMPPERCIKQFYHTSLLQSLTLSRIFLLGAMLSVSQQDSTTAWVYISCWASQQTLVLYQSDVSCVITASISCITRKWRMHSPNQVSLEARSTQE